MAPTPFISRNIIMVTQINLAISNQVAFEVAGVCVNKCVLSRFENFINSSLNCITTKSVGDLPLWSLEFLLPRHLVPPRNYGTKYLNSITI